MFYALIGFVAIIIHVIINYDILDGRRGNQFSYTKDYFYCQYAILLYYLTDALWGVLYKSGLPRILYADTLAYYVALTLSVVLWCKYVVSYLGLGNWAGKVLNIGATLFCVSELGALIVNFYVPFFFHFDQEGNFSTGFLRFIFIIVQSVMFVIVAVPSLAVSLRSTDSSRRRSLTVMFCSLLMIVTGVLQTLAPLVPLYTLGLLIASCILHVFVHEDEKAEIRRRLEENEEKLRENSDIIANAGYGIWKISRNQDGMNTMKADATLQDILGVREMNLTPEELYTFYHSRLNEDLYTIENDDYSSMGNGQVRNRTLRWEHPSKGQIYLSAGGTRYTTVNGEKTISGYCTDITDIKKQEIRSDLIIKSFARSYEFINYIIMSRRVFITSKDNVDGYNDNWQQTSGENVNDAIGYACQEIISPEFRREMDDFTRLDTIDVRMKNRLVLINQFKDMNGVWHEWSYIVADRNEDGTVKHLIWAVRRIEDEKQAELRKQQILEDNIAANKAKTMFLHNMSHEIRTPLNAMFGFSQLLGMPDGSWNDEEREQYNAHVRNSYNMLEMLINDIIDIADSEHGNYRIEIEDVHVNDVCRNALMSVEYRKPEGVDMYFTSDLSDGHTVKSDGRRIQQVLINYLTNSCKNTRQGNIHLHCSAQERPGKLVFSVTDTGCGVPEEKADVIFQRFAKLDQFVQGSGLGLNICQVIADKLGGQVSLDREYRNGARFVFVIDDVQ